jgi:hypothetical protein
MCIHDSPPILYGKAVDEASASPPSMKWAQVPSPAHCLSTQMPTAIPLCQVPRRDVSIRPPRCTPWPNETHRLLSSSHMRALQVWTRQEHPIRPCPSIVSHSCSTTVRYVAFILTPISITLDGAHPLQRLSHTVGVVHCDWEAVHHVS